MYSFAGLFDYIRPLRPLRTRSRMYSTYSNQLNTWFYYHHRLLHGKNPFCCSLLFSGTSNPPPPLTFSGYSIAIIAAIAAFAITIVILLS